MDLLGTDRRRQDLMVLERPRHRIDDTDGPLTCSCGWQGRNVLGRPARDIERAFARHLRRARRARGL